MNLSLLISFICFLVGALASLFEWNLGEFEPVLWGLTFLALGFLWPFSIGRQP